MGLLGVMLVPLFIATWRASVLGLACQGFLIAWAAYRLDPSLRALDTWLTLVDLVVVRGVAAPLLLARVISARKLTGRNDIVPPNLLSWTVAFGLVLAAFNLAGGLVPADGDQRALIAVATSGILLAFLVLASQASPTGQVVGALRLENGIALFDLGGEHPHLDTVVHVGQIAIVAGTIGLYLWLLQGLPETVEATATQDEPTL
jgi:hydrogenase-4 membrane subunit HyfE